MFSTVPLLILLALSVTGLPVEVRNSRVTFSITRRLKFSNGTNQDEAREGAFRDNNTHGRRANFALDNEWWYSVISVGVGYPPTYYDLVVDSGSSIIWLGANKDYEITSTSFQTEFEVGANYESAFFTGILYTDVLTFGDDFITPMPIGVASDYGGMAYNGILGIGPARLSAGVVRDYPDMMLETITHRLFDMGSISKPLVGIFFQPSRSDGTDGGILNFGEPDHDLYTGSIAYIDVTKTFPAAMYWGIEQRITYGTTEILPTTSGIVDCGCTINYLASDAFENYRVATGAAFDEMTTLLSITPEQYGALDDLKFHIGDKTYTFTRNAQIWPRYLNFKINGLEGGVYLVFKSFSTPVGHGEDFRLGYVFLQRFYTSFDVAKSRIGFATTTFTDATTN